MSAARPDGQSRPARPTMNDVAALAGVAITQDAAQLGRLATQLLFARLDGDDSPPRTHVVPTGMVVRGSGEIKPVPTVAASG